MRLKRDIALFSGLSHFHWFSHYFS